MFIKTDAIIFSKYNQNVAYELKFVLQTFIYFLFFQNISRQILLQWIIITT